MRLYAVPKKFKHSLILVPTIIKNTPNGPQTSEEDWLGNDASQLLNNIDNSLFNISSAQANTPSSIVDANHNIIKVEKLIVSEFDNGFLLQEEKNKTQLKKGDIIQIGEATFSVDIKKEIISEINEPTHRKNVKTENQLFDITAKTTTPSYFPEKLKTSTTSMDTLGFLYSSNKNDFTQHTENNSMLNAQNEHQEAFNLNQQTGIPLQRIPTLELQTDYNSLQSQGRSLNYEEIDQKPQTEGKILRDLGINSEQNSRILSSEYGQSGKTLDEKSPLDMLDEYLDDDSSKISVVSDHREDLNNHFNIVQYQPQKTQTEQSFKSSLKKWINLIIN